jgi:cytosine/adenosine deaminase-related metal-dependent hydrolase
MSANEWSLTARWIFPVDAPPLERSVVVIAGDRIAAVEPHGTRTADYDLGNTAILPGLVNAHTHLDLCGARGKIPPAEDFTDWLRAVIQYRQTRTPEATGADIGSGIAESLRYGTTLLGDIAAEGASWSKLAEAPMRKIVYYELLGLQFERGMAAAKKGLDWWVSHRGGDATRAGLSPHAPYSFNSLLLHDVSRGRWIAIHLRESAAEVELLKKRSGPFVRFLEERGIPNAEWLATATAHEIIQQTKRAKSALYIHCNYLHPSTKIGKRGTIVYCPRTHAAFGHPPHPFREFLARGVRVALGTDSLASNPDLDVLAEARFVHAKHPDVAGDVLLRMATLSGAEALGWADETGNLTPGKSADLVVLPLPKEETQDPHQLVLESTTAISGVLFRGNWTRRPGNFDGQ